MALANADALPSLRVVSTTKKPSWANFCAIAPPIPQRAPTGRPLSSSVLPCAARYYGHARRRQGLDQGADVTGIYQRGGADIEAERLAREAVIEALPIEEQRRIYELFYQAGLRAKAGDLSQPAIATTVSNGSDNRIDDDSEPDPQ